MRSGLSVALTVVALVAVHPGQWDPVMVGKLAASLDRCARDAWR
jgi:hypothetical protein